MNKVSEIIQSWHIKYHANEQQREIAEKRYSICLECPSRKTILTNDVCGECGCVLSAKVYSPMPQPCPLEKW